MGTVQASFPGFEDLLPPPNIALFSDDGRYRYLLTREGLGGTRKVMSIGINPSTATAEKNDPTIRKEVAFARRDGFGVLVKTNLFGLISPYPEDLLTVADPVGDNDAVILSNAREVDMVIVAWGNKVKKLVAPRAAHVVKMLMDAGIQLYSYGTNNDGSPKHPLYLPNTTEIVPWSPR